MSEQTIMLKLDKDELQTLHFCLIAGEQIMLGKYIGIQQKLTKVIERSLAHVVVAEERRDTSVGTGGYRG